MNWNDYLDKLLRDHPAAWYLDECVNDLRTTRDDADDDLHQAALVAIMHEFPHDQRLMYLQHIFQRTWFQSHRRLTMPDLLQTKAIGFYGAWLWKLRWIASTWIHSLASQVRGNYSP